MLAVPPLPFHRMSATEVREFADAWTATGRRGARVVDGAFPCGHDPALHTTAQGCTARVGDRECLCHHTAAQARRAAGSPR